MKFAAVLLLACVAVSSAAFTANLVQHTQPAVAKAMFSVRLAAGNDKALLPAVQAAIQSILNQIQNTVQGLLTQAQQIIEQGQQIASQIQQQVLQHVQTAIQHAQAAIVQGQQISAAVTAELQQAAQELQAIGGQAAEQLQAVIQNLLAGIHGATGNKALGLGSLVDAVQNAVTAVQAQVQSAYDQAVAIAQQLVSQIDLPSLAIQAIQQVLPQNLANLVIAQLGLNNKGIIGDLFGNLWGQITDVAGQVASQIAQVVSQVTSIGQSAFAEVQAQASQFLANVASGASHLSAQAAQQIMGHISDLQEALGDQYQAVVDALSNIIVNGK
jgi:hypothetical protein